MVAIAIRPHWRDSATPLNLRMPTDPVPTLIDWQAALANHQHAVHEDSEDCLNVDGTWGPAQVGDAGGSGIYFGYSTADADAVYVWDLAVHARTAWFNYEHWLRQIRAAIVKAEMIRDLSGLRRVLEYANHALLQFNANDLGGPGYVPKNVNRWLQDAALAPHQGLLGDNAGGSFNLRELGEVLYGEAAALKVNPQRDQTFARKCLALLSLAAMPGTGQIARNSTPSGNAGIDQSDTQQVFQWGLCVHGALAAAYVLGLQPDQWILDGLSALDALAGSAGFTYNGMPGPPQFVRTVNGVYVPATGPGQSGDPAYGYWSSNCVALSKWDASQVARATRWGPTVVADEQSRKLSLLYRGAIGG
jgi:hypothetical protein